MSAKTKARLLILFSLAIAAAIPALVDRLPREPETHVIDLKASKYKYEPSRIVVYEGDTIIIKPTATDVTHGFFLDGYDLEFTIKQEGNAFLKYTWEEDDGSMQTDWDKVREIEFVANKPGKYVYRCFQICGNLHPFMTGELIVKPNGPFVLIVSLSVWILFSLFIWHWNIGEPESKSKKPFRINLLEKFPLLDKMVKSRWFHFLVIFPNLTVFYLFILSALWGSPVGNRNIAIIFVWILWWFALKALFVPLGARLWCMICPLPAPADPQIPKPPGRTSAALAFFVTTGAGDFRSFPVAWSPHRNAGAFQGRDVAPATRNGEGVCLFLLLPILLFLSS